MTYDWAENTSCSATTTAERSSFPTLLPVVPQYHFLGYVLFAPSILSASTMASATITIEPHTTENTIATTQHAIPHVLYLLRIVTICALPFLTPRNIHAHSCSRIRPLGFFHSNTRLSLQHCDIRYTSGFAGYRREDKRRPEESGGRHLLGLLLATKSERATYCPSCL
jgi:hypothetical protein